uniref:Uncharacterized protein n=1 Tax=Utricularia reniformis TaxID=192314 RepID=A0A1Y0B1L8_9LAMI|nr:hypothetical protein AEK19_MT1126 [Utricularia reniformis]ART31342.1 hypothetical protein AEK19_MT1126 [Utricularia reniformis]
MSLTIPCSLTPTEFKTKAFANKSSTDSEREKKTYILINSRRKKAKNKTSPRRQQPKIASLGLQLIKKQEEANC